MIGSGGLSRWQKALLLGGTAAACAALAWHLLRGEDEEEAQETLAEECVKNGETPPPPKRKVQALPPGSYFKVTDPEGKNVGLRHEPEVTDAARRGKHNRPVLVPGEVFEVCEIMQGPTPPQNFLRLSDERGWVVTHSIKDGRLLCSPAAPGERPTPKATEEP